jgi:hypothetical protein
MKKKDRKTGQANSSRLPKSASGLVLLKATVIVGLLYLLHEYALPPLPHDHQISSFFTWDALRFKLFDSGPIPYFILGTFWFGLMYLEQIASSKIKPIRKVIADEGEVLDAARKSDTQTLEEVIRKNVQNRNDGYYGHRFHRLLERWKQDQDLNAVIALKNEILEIDEENFSLSFVAVRWTEWALPLLGFLGTVVGIGAAVGGMKNGVRIVFEKGQITKEALA